LPAAYFQEQASGIGCMQANPLFAATSTAPPGNAAKDDGYSVGVGPLLYRDAPRDAPADAWPDPSAMAPAWLPAGHVQNCLYESRQGPASTIVFGAANGGAAGAATPGDRSHMLSDAAPDDDVYYSVLTEASSLRLSLEHRLTMYDA